MAKCVRQLAPKPKANEEDSGITEIVNYPKNPIELFVEILTHVSNEAYNMNVASLDAEFGVLNRSVAYRGLTDIDRGVTFVTRTNSRNYKNMKDNPRVCVTFYFPELVIPSECGTQMIFTSWQVRMIDAVATELDAAQVKRLWDEEPLHARIRAHICENGKPIDMGHLRTEHTRLLEEFKGDCCRLKQPECYTGFKIISNRWDFYKHASNKIADRIQYRKSADQQGGWEIMHVAA